MLIIVAVLAMLSLATWNAQADPVLDQSAVLQPKAEPTCSDSLPAGETAIEELLGPSRAGQMEGRSDGHSAARDGRAGSSGEEQVDDAMLQRLHGQLAHLDGFLDIQFILVGPPRFVALFDGTPPQLLPDIDAPYPVTAESADAAVQPVAHEDATAPDQLLTMLGSGTRDGAGEEEAQRDLIPQACPGRGPGTRISGCTLAWLFHGDDGRLYATTAGHCTGSAGARVGGWGTVVYRRNAGVGADYSVIRVDAHRESEFDPAMCHWGGPTAQEDAGGWDTELVVQYGYGLVYGTQQFTRPREGVLWGRGWQSFSYLGGASPGDSGSPMRFGEGPAVGVVTHTVAIPATGLGFGPLVYGTRLSYFIEVTEQQLGIDLEIATAPIS